MTLMGFLLLLLIAAICGGIGQSLGERLDHRVESDCRHRRHVQHATHGGAAAADHPFAAVTPGVTVERRHAGQGADLPPIGLPQFAQFRRQRCRQARPHARH